MELSLRLEGRKELQSFAQTETGEHPLSMSANVKYSDREGPWAAA